LVWEGFCNNHGLTPSKTITGLPTPPPTHQRPIHQRAQRTHTHLTVGNCSVEGLRRLLAHLGASKGGGVQVVLTDVREELVVYVNGLPYIRRWVLFGPFLGWGGGLFDCWSGFGVLVKVAGLGCRCRPKPTSKQQQIQSNRSNPYLSRSNQLHHHCPAPINSITKTFQSTTSNQPHHQTKPPGSSRCHLQPCTTQECTGGSWRLWRLL